MADTGNRTLRLLSLMQSRRKWARADLAGRLGVSVRTLRRDVQRLPDLGCPVEAQPGIDGGYRPAPGASLPPLVLDDDEAVALVVGLQAAAQTAVTGMAEASVRALTKVVQVLPVLSDIPLLGTALFSHNVLVYFAALLAVGLYFFLYRTRAGLDLRSVGENPKAADSLGIPVVWTRLWTSTAGGALMGIAGAYLPMVFTGTFTEGIVGGRGWLAIALTFFGGWRPQYIVAGALFFATMDVVALRAEVSNVDIPSQVLLVVPYVATLLVMIFAFRWARVPAFLGRNYDRESRTA